MYGRIRFTDEFKQDAVTLVVERGYAVSVLAERLEISAKLLYTWKAQFAKSPSVRSEVADQAAEIRRLKVGHMRLSQSICSRDMSSGGPCNLE